MPVGSPCVDDDDCTGSLLCTSSVCMASCENGVAPQGGCSYNDGSNNVSCPAGNIFTKGEAATDNTCVPQCKVGTNSAKCAYLDGDTYQICGDGTNEYFHSNTVDCEKVCADGEVKTGATVNGAKCYNVDGGLVCAAETDEIKISQDTKPYCATKCVKSTDGSLTKECYLDDGSTYKACDASMKVVKMASLSENCLPVCSTTKNFKVTAETQCAHKAAADQKYEACETGDYVIGGACVTACENGDTDCGTKD